MRVLRIARVANCPRRSKPGMGLPAFKVVEHLPHTNLWLSPDAPDAGWDEPVDMPDHVELVQVPFRWVTADASGQSAPIDTVRRLAALGRLNAELIVRIVRWRPDLVHVHSPMYLPAALAAGRALRVPVVITFHGADFIRVYERPWLGRLVARADRLLTVSSHMLDGLRAYTPRGVEPIWIGNGVDLDIFGPGEGSIERETVIVAVGSLLWRKAFDVLLRAMARVHAAAPSWRLHIFGEGEDRSKLESLIGELGLQGVAVLQGERSRRGLADELRRAQIFALSSVTEGFPKVVLEAMACGLPVVSTDVGNAPEAVGGAGLIVPARDEAALADALLELIEDDTKREACARAALERAPLYSWPTCVARTQAVYEELVPSG